MPKQWLNVADIAQELDVSPDTVRSWINHPEKEKRLKAVKAGRDWRIKRSDLEAFLEARSNLHDEEEP